MKHTKKLIAAALIFAATTAAASDLREKSKQDFQNCAARADHCNVLTDEELIEKMRKVQRTTVRHLQKRIDKCGLQPGQNLQELLTWSVDCPAQQSK